jgi:hypothetical protein
MKELLADTDAGRKRREEWLRRLFSNPHLDPLDKVVLAALVLWYFPSQVKEPDGSVLMDFQEVGEMVGLSSDVVKKVLEQFDGNALFLRGEE